MLFETTFDVMSAAREGGTLHTLLRAEAAGGLDERAPILESLADDLREAGGTPAVTTARFIYADNQPEGRALSYFQPMRSARQGGSARH